MSRRHRRPALPWRIVWLALALIGLAGIIVAVVILLSTQASSSPARAGIAAPRPAPTRARCPETDRRPAPSARGGANRALVPPGATSVLLCRYGLLHGGGLVDHRLVSSDTLTARLAESLNALPRRREIICPLFDNGQVLIAHFLYASGPEDPVTIALSGCESVGNGHVDRLSLGERGVAAIVRLVPRAGSGGLPAG
jgi:hypothetical protein